MAHTWLVVLVCCYSVVWVNAGQAPGASGAPDIPISSEDRVYLSDQTSGTVSVVDPAAGKLLGTIKLGSNLGSGMLTAVYTGQLLVHGMGLSPDHTTVATVCVGSNAVVFIDTATNKVKHTAYVGRAPHEAMWNPEGTEVWVSVRGSDYIQILNGKNYTPTAQVKVGNPSLVWSHRPLNKGHYNHSIC